MGQNPRSGVVSVSPLALSSSFERMERASLLGIDYHCRDVILEMLLLNRDQSWCDTVIDQEVMPFCLKLQFASRNLKKLEQHRICKHRIYLGNANVLLVCRQLWGEGRRILYGRNSFVSYHFPQLKNRLPVVIGARNMALIQRLALGLPMKHKRDDPTIHLGGFLELLDEKLPALRELTLTTEFIRDHSSFIKDAAGTNIGEEYRALLNTSAWITCRHQNLKKAIWMAESGATWAEQLPNDGLASGLGWAWAGDGPHDDLAWSMCCCRFTVKILAENQRFRVGKQRRIELLPCVRTVMAHDIILNSQAIRRAGWSNLAGAKPQDFALANNAASSEPSRALVKRTEGGIVYADWQTAHDHLRDKFKYLSLKDKSRLTGKRVTGEQKSGQKSSRDQIDP